MMVIIFLILCAILGLGVGLVLANVLLKRKNSISSQEHLEDNIKTIFKSAQAQRELILEEAHAESRKQFASETTRLDEEREVLKRLAENFEQECDEKQAEIDKAEQELEKKAQLLVEKQNQIQDETQKVETLLSDQQKVLKDLEASLELKAGYKRDELVRHMSYELIESQKLGSSRFVADSMEQLKATIQKYAYQSLHAVYFRYQPKFIWPKSSFTVQVSSKNILQKYFEEESPVIKTLLENTDSAISVLTINEEQPSLIKISGGLGTDKEIIRLTLEEMISRNIFHEDRVKAIIEKHKKYLEKLVLKMGEDALKSLGLKKSMHPEILKLIGSLNYRTSHRQNQYYHSIEVARLAGMIANEVGVDCEVAKRAGILHDIGKVLDYKIEGSHAVISGDYATRYGEEENVVDTVLAHHDDKSVETPYAYILKAADALSGARPGARVDMEEGYNRRIDGISGVVNSFADFGVVGSGIMYAGREVHVYVDNARVKYSDISDLAQNIANKLEAEVEYPGQIRVTVIRRTEVTEVA